MKIYEVKYEVKGMYNTEVEKKFFVNKENAEKFVAENNKPWTNSNGITFNTAWMGEVLETED